MPKHSLGAGGDSTIVTNKSSYLFKKMRFSLFRGFPCFIGCLVAHLVSEALGLFWPLLAADTAFEV